MAYGRAGLCALAFRVSLAEDNAVVRLLSAEAKSHLFHQQQRAGGVGHDRFQLQLREQCGVARGDLRHGGSIGLEFGLGAGGHLEERFVAVQPEGIPPQLQIRGTPFAEATRPHCGPFLGILRRGRCLGNGDEQFQHRNLLHGRPAQCPALPAAEHAQEPRLAHVGDGNPCLVEQVVSVFRHIPPFFQQDVVCS